MVADRPKNHPAASIPASPRLAGPLPNRAAPLGNAQTVRHDECGPPILSPACRALPKARPGLTIHPAREPKMHVLETRQVRKSFGEGDARVEALRGVDVGVNKGEMLAIMGRSGSGKSTLLTLLGGVDVPTSGQVLLEGNDVASMSDDERTLVRRRRIGFVFQSFNLLPILTAEENVSLPLELDGVSPSAAIAKAGKMLELVGLEKRRNHLPGKLSGGEQQRVAIARALVIDPAIVLADEPTGNLDTANGTRIIAILRELVDQHGQTLVLVTHDPGIAAIADRVIYLADGLVEREETNRVIPVRPRRVASERTA
jgi:putative ABC transport system ATP-binding protein